MKRLIILTATILFAFSFSATAQSKAKDMMDMPYKASYSSNFKMGNQKYAKMILDLWKDWDDNAFNRHDYFSDTITAYFPDGSMVKGKSAFMENSKKYRDGFTAVKSIVHAWVPLLSEDQKMDVVCVWGQEDDTTADGKSTKSNLHEVWFFNKDGKISAFRQWMAKVGEGN